MAQSVDTLYASVVSAPIDPAEALGRVGGPEDGAALLFLGVVRNSNEGRHVTGVGYEAYDDMARAVLLEIAAEARTILGGGRVAVVHRVGELAVGEVSVAIAVSSPHRSEAFAASRHVIEEIKKRLPVWKHERYTDGDGRWLDGHHPAPGGEEPIVHRETAAGADDDDGGGSVHHDAAAAHEGRGGLS